MTPVAFKARCSVIGLTTHKQIATALGLKNRNTIRRWISGETPVQHWADAKLNELEREWREK